MRARSRAAAAYRIGAGPGARGGPAAGYPTAGRRLRDLPQARKPREALLPARVYPDSASCFRPSSNHRIIRSRTIASYPRPVGR